MKRFVSYLYAVENQQKTQNAGFAKIEQRTGRNRVEIHLRDGRYNGKRGKVYLYLRKEGILHGFLLGEIEFRGSQADFQFGQNKNNLLETEYTLDKMNGILIRINEQIAYLSQWDEEVIDLSSFQVWEPKQSEPDALIHQKEELEDVKNAEQKPLPEPSLRKADIAGAVQLQQHVRLPKRESWEERWERMQNTYPVLGPFEKEKETVCLRIELKDIRMLPKDFWNSMNNSFLLHGFFNYRYLIFGRLGENWILGVPGVFQNQEHVMASIFGFPEFLPQNSDKNETDGFGYWYRVIDIESKHK